MKAMVLNRPGTPLKWTELPDRQPSSGEVRVKVAAIGVNFADIYARRGWYPSPVPFVPGNEFAGTVDKAGQGVTEFKAGDRVATGSGGGGSWADAAWASEAGRPVRR